MQSRLLVVAVAILTANIVAQSNVCQTSSQDALQACQLGAQSSYSLALGQCANESGSDQTSCHQTALKTKQQALTTCQDQFTARQIQARAVSNSAAPRLPASLAPTT